METTFLSAPVSIQLDQAEPAPATPELESVLDQLAKKAVDLGISPDAFVSAAYAAYLKADPALRESLEDAHFMARLSELRRRGLIGAA